MRILTCLKRSSIWTKLLQFLGLLHHFLCLLLFSFQALSDADNSSGFMIILLDFRGLFEPTTNVHPVSFWQNLPLQSFMNEISSLCPVPSARAPSHNDQLLCNLQQSFPIIPPRRAWGTWFQAFYCLGSTETVLYSVVQQNDWRSSMENWGPAMKPKSMLWISGH